MSAFYDLASLVLVPSGYKASKVYAQKPLTTDGQLSFTRSTGATRVGPDGLIEKVRTNLALYSEDLTDAAWAKSNSSITANATTAPDGTTTADKLIENTANSTHLVSQNITASNIPFTYSVYVKGDTTTRVRVQMSDLTTGDIRLDYDFITDTSLLNASGTRGSWTPLGYTKTDMSGGWVRISISGIKGAGSTAAIAVFLLDASGNSVYTGDGTSGIFVWGAQLETGDIATQPILTTSAAVSVGPVANVPRLDYLNSSCPRLILEGQRTNAQTFSEQHNNAAWAKLNLSVTANAGTSPDGYANADLVYPSTGSVNVQNYNSQTRSGLTIGASYTQSVFLKAAGFTWAIVDDAPGNPGAWFNLVTGTIGTVKPGCTAKIENYGNGWYRCSVTSNANDTTGYGDYRLANADNVALATANGTDGILAWGFQFEAGSYATSYIPTLGAAVTRGADAASKTGISSLIGQTEGTMFLDFVPQSIDTADDFRVQVYATSTAEWFFIGNVNGQIRGFIRAGAATQYDYVAENVVIGKRYKLAISYSSAGASFYVNGVKENELISSISTPATSIFGLGNSNTSADNLLISQVNQALLFKTRLTNAQLAELTTL